MLEETNWCFSNDKVVVLAGTRQRQIWVLESEYLQTYTLLIIYVLTAKCPHMSRTLALAGEIVGD